MISNKWECESRVVTTPVDLNLIHIKKRYMWNVSTLVSVIFSELVHFELIRRFLMKCENERGNSGMRIAMSCGI